MLKPAILYKDEIQRRFKEYYYTDDMMYETGCLENWCPEINEGTNEEHYQYAIVDNTNKLIGYLSYRINWYASRVYNFGLFSFDRGNIIVGKELYHKMEELVGRFHRVEWRAVSGNPACRSYDNYIKKHNGTKHILKDAIKDRDGNYHDDYIYEIVKEVEG